MQLTRSTVRSVTAGAAVAIGGAVVGILWWNLGLGAATTFGLTWGAVVWVFVAYPETRSISFTDVEWPNRWLLVAGLLMTATAATTIRLQTDLATAGVLIWVVVAVAVGMSGIGAAIERQR